MNEIRFLATSKDYWRFVRFVFFHQPRYYLGVWLWIPYIVLIDVVVQWFLPYQSLFPVIFIPLATLIYGFGLWRRHSRALKSFLKGGAMFVAISPQHLHVKNENVDTKISWRMVKGIFQDKYSFYFQIENTGSGKLLAYIIPRHAFASLEEAESFRERAHGYWQEQSGQTATMRR
jgi:hypothetical protein